ncbi:MAG: Uroporphyrinogen decarboxylase [Chlamydiales bacterium]|nr:Uroporphyrinogen decarboxylase [Chlamydiales bacterium]MCH9619839.1 Uroporphyrinogen decarboxylase [Chlamydiales bacterium]MCH9622734.1 Uroporphyrinogen decarboxylase [Chlamydiales bacterium]
MPLLDALTCKNKNRAPIWLMRQAGRYLPDYAAFKKRQSLLEMFHDPKTIVEVTKLPFASFPLDGAILFSDILTVLNGLGVSYTFDPGPKIDFSHFKPKKNAYPHIKIAIEQLKQELSVPLLGFAGAPFTIASYLIEGETTKTFLKMKRMLFTKPKEFEKMLDQVTEETITYLNLQIDAGVDAIQLFDSWANHIGPDEFRRFSLPYLEQIVKAIKPKVPVIVFARGMHAMDIAKIAPSAISLDWSYDLPKMRKRIDRSIALQGNLDPTILYGDQTMIEERASRILNAMEGDPGYIFNLGHGILPDIPFENVKFLVNYVRSRKI